uniref:Kazal-like domain-containing protein n=1 Tax=Mastacembelus armatus TaxID=205130 RepID=A0A3Q3MDV8_9TELE
VTPSCPDGEILACPMNFVPVCGSDGNTYPNESASLKAFTQCHHRLKWLCWKKCSSLHLVVKEFKD